jgi:hypothetical protein
MYNPDPIKLAQLIAAVNRSCEKYNQPIPAENKEECLEIAIDTLAESLQERAEKLRDTIGQISNFKGTIPAQLRVLRGFTARLQREVQKLETLAREV